MARNSSSRSLFVVVLRNCISEREEGAEGFRAPSAVCSPQDVVDGARVEDAEDLGAVDRALELALRCVFGEVEEGPGEGGGRDAVDGLDVFWPKRGAAVWGDAVDGASAAGCARDVDCRAVVVAKAEVAGR